MKAGNLPNQIEAMGASRLNYSLDNANPIKISWNKYAEPMEHPRFDMHYVFEFGFVLKGAVQRFYTEKIDGIYCREGDAWFCGMWEPHGFSIVEVPVELLVILVWPPALNALRCPALSGLSLAAPFSVPLSKRPQVHPSLKPQLLEMARSLCESDMRNPFSNFRSWLRFQEMLSLIIETWNDGKGMTGLNPTGVHLQTSIAPALELVFCRREPVSLTEGAAACGMGKAKFARIFSEMMGTTYAKFSMHHRLGLAVKALLDGNTLKDAADEGGFTDISHLHRVFIANFSCSPDEYRRKYLS